MKLITEARLYSINIIPADKAFPHCRITSVQKEHIMTEQTPDNPDHGTPENPITEDYNVENAVDSTETPEVPDEDGSDDSEPDAVEPNWPSS